MHRRAVLFSLVILIALGLAVAAPGLAQTPKKGGVIRVGLLGEPPSLDTHWTTAVITEVLTNHIYEGLYTLDENYRPVPMLAEGMPTVSRDGLTYTIKLRQGIKFHNGKEMTSEDVVPSLKRWGQRSVRAKNLFAVLADIRAIDKYTVEIKLKEQLGTVVISLAVPNNFAAIYPKEIAEKFPAEVKATEYVGTGPFKLAEWRPDQYIRMVRFDDYKPRSEKPSGYGGAKIVYVDEVRWIPVPDVATRTAQIETGELDVAEDLNLDSYERLKANPNLRPVVARPYFWPVAVFNKKEGLGTNQKLRQAWQAAVDIEPIMKAAAGGRSEFYRMDSSLIFAELAEWHTKIPGLPWNERNKEKAKRLLQESGYKGQPIRYLTTQEYKWMYDVALMTKQQLEDVGFTVDLQVLDWSTLVQRRNNPKEYDVFTTGIGSGAMFDPTHHDITSCVYPGWNCDEEVQALQTELAKETDYKKRFALWEKQTRLFYEKVPAIRYGDIFGLRAIRTTVKDFNDKTERIRLFNVWLDK
jgi:peptide/nickel transport system substrate-binding protein